MSGSTSNNYIGSGSDTITLNMSEDQALGVDAEFTVNVDGQQIGGVQTVTAQRSSGQDESFTFAGDFAPGSHNVTVTFANNFIYPGLSGDRNLYVDGVTYDGQTVSSSTTPIYQSPWFPPNSTAGDVYGNAVFAVNDSTPTPGGASSTGTNPGPVTVGSGSDTLVLNMAEDAYAGDAQFTVSVDGQQIGGLQTVTAIVGEGQSQEFDVKGNFGGGTHTVTVNFTNDDVGGYYPDGTPDLPPGTWALDTADRNLYVLGASLDGGAPSSDAPWEQSSSGTHNYAVTAGSNANAGSSAPSASAAPTSDNAPIPTSALSTQSSMSFMASPTTATTSDTAATTGSGSTSESAAGSGSTGTTPATDTTVAATTPSTQDFSVPTSTSSATDTSGSGGSGTSSSIYQMAAAPATHTHHHAHG